MNEQRLDQIRDQAWNDGVVAGRGVDVAGGPIPHKAGYYGQPVVRPPVWTWEIPIYFFVGSTGGMAAVIALAATLFDHADLARSSILFSTIAAIISPILLIMDLGRPQRFLNMLRVFKPQSAMSMGAWILVLFSVCVIPACIALVIHARGIFGEPFEPIIRIVTDALLIGSALFGVLLATYTGVLLGATVTPAWFTHRVFLPMHFGTAGLGSSAALLELLGHRVAALNAIGVLAAGTETILAFALLINKHGAADRALHRGVSGVVVQTAEILAGPLSLLLRSFGLIPFAAISFVTGALLSRFGWLLAGKISGRDPEAVFALQRS